MKVSVHYSNLLHFGFSTESHDLMVRDQSFVMYNFKDDSFRPICDITEVGDRVQSVGTYVEGLFPLSTDKRLNMSCRQDESSIKEARKEEK